MMNARGQARLVDHRCEEFRLLGQVGVQAFDRDRARETNGSLEPPQVHARHAALRDLGVDRVTANDFVLGRRPAGPPLDGCDGMAEGSCEMALTLGVVAIVLVVGGLTTVLVMAGRQAREDVGPESKPEDFVAPVSSGAYRWRRT